MFNPSFFKFLFGFAFIILISFGVIFVAGFLDERENLAEQAAAAASLPR